MQIAKSMMHADGTQSNEDGQAIGQGPAGPGHIRPHKPEVLQDHSIQVPEMVHIRERQKAQAMPLEQEVEMRERQMREMREGSAESTSSSARSQSLYDTNEGNLHP